MVKKKPEEKEEIKTEDDFWIELEKSDYKIFKPVDTIKKTNDIESGVSAGIISTYKQIEAASPITENELRALSKYGTHPFLGSIIVFHCINKRKVEGWDVKILREFYKIHAETIRNELFSKKVKRVLEKVREQSMKGDNW